MQPASIADAIRAQSELLQTLKDAYWEASSMASKDAFFDLINAVYQEQTEMAKLSIQDHDLEYEPISLEFRRCRSSLSELRKRLDGCVARASTATRLESAIGDVVALFSH